MGQVLRFSCSGNLPFWIRIHVHSLLSHSVPFQVFLCDPDGYFIKFCTCNCTDDAMNDLKFIEKVPSMKIDDQPNVEEDDGEGEEDIRGIGKFWKGVRN